MIKLNEDDWLALEDEFTIYVAESGRDREACFDDSAYEIELYEFVTAALGTDNWEATP